MEVELNGRKIDISTAVPLKIKDWKELEKKGIKLKNLQESSIEDMANVVFHILRKVDSSVTQDEIDNLELSSPTFQGVLRALGGEVVDRPI